ncbi:peptidylprolyl isomerase/peptidyl-prolyl cis-trans isomerase B (cyclophilin B) [Flexibacter flexilis DSM 6793]|uniref:Peptidyl-prolyl cis-trans isomerase n=1 Tax=Flexibacter flexilis DSM 6793 TaxID=927664 RepID=A0A1I1IGI4_9BACT|nr:peptidylprolyl isomerase [Flexibacter flexilis]SFC32310.1 peptidylprolyl isomerase/peptidyl-prolyl cis-trans isomerase B (cyclophilin B) [Flexibacter flexilis DSM 6793]
MKNTFILFLLLLLASPMAIAQEKKAKPKGRDYLITIETAFGNIELVLFDETPQHKENFLKLAKSGFYDGTTFHRIIKNFMIQGGDPNSKNSNANDDGAGGPGYTVPAEFLPNRKHVLGALAAARMGDNVNPKKESSGSQFYLVENPSGTHFLDSNYTVFGQTVMGIDVIHKIAEQPKGMSDRPLKDITMKVKVQKMRRKKIAERYNYDFDNQPSN